MNKGGLHVRNHKVDYFDYLLVQCFLLVCLIALAQLGHRVKHLIDKIQPIVPLFSIPLCNVDVHLSQRAAELRNKINRLVL